MQEKNLAQGAAARMVFGAVTSSVINEKGRSHCCALSHF
jgi:hypothetical protein